jgi:hypothetical protein
MTDDSADIVEVIAKLRAMGAARVQYRGCEVVFDALPAQKPTQESAIDEYTRIALASAQ